MSPSSSRRALGGGLHRVERPRDVGRDDERAPAEALESRTPRRAGRPRCGRAGRRRRRDGRTFAAPARAPDAGRRTPSMTAPCGCVYPATAAPNANVSPARGLRAGRPCAASSLPVGGLDATPRAAPITRTVVPPPSRSASRTERGSSDEHERPSGRSILLRRRRWTARARAARRTAPLIARSRRRPPAPRRGWLDHPGRRPPAPPRVDAEGADAELVSERLQFRLAYRSGNTDRRDHRRGGGDDPGSSGRPAQAVAERPPRGVPRRSPLRRADRSRRVPGRRELLVEGRRENIEAVPLRSVRPVTTEQYSQYPNPSNTYGGLMASNPAPVSWSRSGCSSDLGDVDQDARHLPVRPSCATAGRAGPPRAVRRRDGH